MNKAKPPTPNLQTETLSPETPESFTKNSELAWPHTPKMQKNKLILSKFYYLYSLI